MKLVIKRSEWARGSVKDTERVANLLYAKQDGTRCCLGFLGNACGYTDQELQGYGLPSDVVNDAGLYNKWGRFLLHGCDENNRRTDSLIVDDLIEINDDTNITESEREADIAEIFAKHGVEVEFVD